eukprot:9258069-Prorocentrum_lima.AAC.1
MTERHAGREGGCARRTVGAGHASPPSCVRAAKDKRPDGTGSTGGSYACLRAPTKNRDYRYYHTNQ